MIWFIIFNYCFKSVVLLYSMYATFVLQINMYYMIKDSQSAMG